MKYFTHLSKQINWVQTDVRGANCTATGQRILFPDASLLCVWVGECADVTAQPCWLLQIQLVSTGGRQLRPQVSCLFSCQVDTLRLFSLLLPLSSHLLVFSLSRPTIFSVVFTVSPLFLYLCSFLGGYLLVFVSLDLPTFDQIFYLPSPPPTPLLTSYHSLPPRGQICHTAEARHLHLTTQEQWRWGENLDKIYCSSWAPTSPVCLA